MRSRGLTTLYDTLSALSAAHSVQTRWAVLTGVLSNLGADQVNYAVLDVTHSSRFDAGVTQFSSMRADWIEHYLAAEMYNDDVHVRRVREGRLSPYRFVGDKVQNQLAGRERAVIAEAAVAGLRSQISVIMPDQFNPNAPVAGMTIGSSLKAEEFDSVVAGKEGDLIAMSMLFHSLSIGEVRREQVGAAPLSRRERDCLGYFAEGYRATRVAEVLGLAEATVNLHLANARRKLKAHTTAHAVARAMLFGELEPARPIKTAR